VGRHSFLEALPPLARRMAGRPATMRITHPSKKESKFSTSRMNVSRTVKCSKCLQYGHNKKSCTNEAMPTVPNQPRKMGRPRKYLDNSMPTDQGVDPNQPFASRASRSKRRPNSNGDMTSISRKKQCVTRGGGTSSLQRTLVDEHIEGGWINNVLEGDGIVTQEQHVEGDGIDNLEQVEVEGQSGGLQVDPSYISQEIKL